MSDTVHSGQELDRRRRAWKALSEMFLDTEVRCSFPWIAGELLASGYSPEELDAIWRREMVPVYAGNLFQVAGQWDSLAVDEPALLRRNARGPGLFAWIPALFLAGPWRGVLALRARLERAPAEQRQRLVDAWTSFAHVYVGEQTLDVELVARLRDCGLGRAECEASFAEDFRPVYRELLLRSERKSEASRARDVATAIGRAFA